MSNSCYWKFVYISAHSRPASQKLRLAAEHASMVTHLIVNVICACVLWRQLTRFLRKPWRWHFLRRRLIRCLSSFARLSTLTSSFSTEPRGGFAQSVNSPETSVTFWTKYFMRRKRKEEIDNLKDSKNFWWVDDKMYDTHKMVLWDGRWGCFRRSMCLLAPVYEAVR